MKHYIDPSNGKKYGYYKQGTREMSDAEFLLSQVTPLDDLKQSKRNELSSACENHIINTLFESSALGSVHSYDCRKVDQLNLCVMHGGGNGGLVYAHTQPSFEPIDHSAAQVQDVMADMAEHIRLARAHYSDKKAEVDAITNDNAGQRQKLADITW